MKNYTTKKHTLYYDEVIRLHIELHYGAKRISNILPVSHSTISRWIATFAQETKEATPMNNTTTGKEKTPNSIKSVDLKVLEALPMEEQVKQLKAALFKAEMRADLNEEIINVAEKKFKIQISKKAGAKQ